MRKDLIYNSIVSNCTDCGGTGILSKEGSNIYFCKCKKYYFFICNMIDRGVPVEYIFNYSKISFPLSSSKFVFYKNDKDAFNLYMNCIDKYKIALHEAPKMYKFNSDNLDGIMLYNLGLETFKDYELCLYRLLKYISDNNLFCILSFAIDFDKLKNKYQSENILKFIYGWTNRTTAL